MKALRFDFRKCIWTINVTARYFVSYMSCILSKMGTGEPPKEKYSNNQNNWVTHSKNTYTDQNYC